MAVLLSLHFEKEAWDRTILTLPWLALTLTLTPTLMPSIVRVFPITNHSSLHTAECTQTMFVRTILSRCPAGRFVPGPYVRCVPHRP